MNDSKALTERLFGSREIAVRAAAIAKELANRDLFALKDFPLFLRRESKREFTVQCVTFFDLVHDIVVSGNNIDNLLKADKRLVWLNVAIERSKKDEQYDTDILAMHICIHLINTHRITLDEHVQIF